MKVYTTFVTSKDAKEYLNIVMDFYEKNLFEVINDNSQNGRIGSINGSVMRNDKFKELQQKMHIYQFLKGLSYIHSLGICHRDIKPHNMLVSEW